MAVDRDGLKVAGTLGVPPETDWAYSDANPGPFTQQPPHKAYVGARRQVALRYYTFPLSRWNLHWCIANGYPIAFGITVYENFESQEVAQTGLVPMPSPGEAVAGGHCMVIVGFDDTRGLYEVDNSWGFTWGDEGRCWLPYEYVEGSDASDFWTVRREG